MLEPSVAFSAETHRQRLGLKKDDDGNADLLSNRDWGRSEAFGSDKVDPYMVSSSRLGLLSFLVLCSGITS